MSSHSMNDEFDISTFFKILPDHCMLHWIFDISSDYQDFYYLQTHKYHTFIHTNMLRKSPHIKREFSTNQVRLLSLGMFYFSILNSGSSGLSRRFLKCQIVMLHSTEVSDPNGFDAVLGIDEIYIQLRLDPQFVIYPKEYKSRFWKSMGLTSNFLSYSETGNLRLSCATCSVAGNLHGLPIQASDTYEGVKSYIKRVLSNFHNTPVLVNLWPTKEPCYLPVLPPPWICVLYDLEQWGNFSYTRDAYEKSRIGVVRYRIAMNNEVITVNFLRRNAHSRNKWIASGAWYAKILAKVFAKPGEKPSFFNLLHNFGIESLLILTFGGMLMCILYISVTKSWRFGSFWAFIVVLDQPSTAVEKLESYEFKFFCLAFWILPIIFVSNFLKGELYTILTTRTEADYPGSLSEALHNWKLPILSCTEYEQKSSYVKYAISVVQKGRLQSNTGIHDLLTELSNKVVYTRGVYNLTLNISKSDSLEVSGRKFIVPDIFVQVDEVVTLGIVENYVILQNVYSPVKTLELPSVLSEIAPWVVTNNAFGERFADGVARLEEAGFIQIWSKMGFSYGNIMDRGGISDEDWNELLWRRPFQRLVIGRNALSSFSDEARQISIDKLKSVFLLAILCLSVSVLIYFFELVFIKIHHHNM